MAVLISSSDGVTLLKGEWSRAHKEHASASVSGPCSRPGVCELGADASPARRDRCHSPRCVAHESATACPLVEPLNAHHYATLPPYHAPFLALAHRRTRTRVPLLLHTHHTVLSAARGQHQMTEEMESSAASLFTFASEQVRCVGLLETRW